MPNRPSTSPSGVRGYRVIMKTHASSIVFAPNRQLAKASVALSLYAAGVYRSQSEVFMNIKSCKRFDEYDEFAPLLTPYLMYEGTKYEKFLYWGCWEDSFKTDLLHKILCKLSYGFEHSGLLEHWQMRGADIKLDSEDCQIRFSAKTHTVDRPDNLSLTLTGYKKYLGWEPKDLGAEFRRLILDLPEEIL